MNAKKWDRIFKNEKIRGGYCIMLDNIRQKFPLFSDLKINLIILCAFVIICIYFIYNLVGKNSKGKAVLIQGLLLILLFVAGIFIVGVLYELLISLFSLNVYMDEAFTFLQNTGKRVSWKDIVRQAE